MLNNSFQEIINANEPVLVDFYAEWCGPCKQMPPILKDLKDKMGEQIRIFKVNVDQHNDVAAHFEVTSIPTLMIFKKGTLLWREPGIKSAKQLQQLLEQHLS